MKNKKSPATPPATETAPDAALAAMEHEFEVVTGPDTSELETRIRSVLETIQKKKEQVHQFLLRKQVDIAYDLVEIGWILLQGKQAFPHGGTGNRNATKDESDSVSLSLPEGGFFGWVESTFGSLNKRTAQRYMNAARNLKLTPESTLEQVRALRENNALNGLRMTDLYLPPGGEETEVDAEQDADAARRAAEVERFEASLFDLTQLGVEKRVFIALPKPRLQTIKAHLTDLQKAVAEALKA